MQVTFWTEARLLHLDALLAEKTLTAGRIAALLGCTRNMVIGKVYRDHPDHAWPGADRPKAPRKASAAARQQHISLAPVGVKKAGGAPWL